MPPGDKWFYTPSLGIHSLSDLVGFYHASVGANGHLEIDFAIDRTGDVAPLHKTAYKNFGAWIRSCYGSPVAVGSLSSGASTFTVQLPAPSGSSIDRASLVEDQSLGQIVFDYSLEAEVSGAWVPFSSGILGYHIAMYGCRVFLSLSHNSPNIISCRS